MAASLRDQTLTAVPSHQKQESSNLDSDSKGPTHHSLSLFTLVSLRRSLPFQITMFLHSPWSSSAPCTCCSSLSFGLVVRLMSGSGEPGINLSGFEANPAGSALNPSTIQVLRSMPSGPNCYGQPPPLTIPVSVILLPHLSELVSLGPLGLQTHTDSHCRKRSKRVLLII